MSPQSVGLCILCHERPDEVREAVRSASDWGFDEILVLDQGSSPGLADIPGATLLRSNTNLGVTAGRNLLARRSAADIVCFLDDDAVLVSGSADAIRMIFRGDTIGAIAFRITRADGSAPSNEHPFRGPSRDPGTARDCAYFLGGAVAIRRTAMLAVGGYDDRFFYSTEEIDLAFSFERDGWSLRYEPAITMEHRPSASGRLPHPEVPARRIRNRLMLVRKHLPVLAAVPHALIWIARTYREARATGDARPWLAAVAEGMRVPVERQPLRCRQLMKIHRRGGRVMW